MDSIHVQALVNDRIVMCISTVIEITPFVVERWQIQLLLLSVMCCYITTV
jgi:hypothetical protein